MALVKGPHRRNQANRAALPARLPRLADRMVRAFRFNLNALASLTLLPAHPNLIVTRTFSKAYALAGLRVLLAHQPRNDSVEPLGQGRERAVLSRPLPVAAVRARGRRCTRHLRLPNSHTE